MERKRISDGGGEAVGEERDGGREGTEKGPAGHRPVLIHHTFMEKAAIKHSGSCKSPSPRLPSGFTAGGDYMA